MELTLAVPAHLADQLRTLAAQQRMSISELGEYVLALGLQRVTSETTVQLALPEMPQRTIASRSPIVANGAMRPLQISIEPAPADAADAH